MRTTYDAILDLDLSGLAHVLTLSYLCGMTGEDDPDFLKSHEEYGEMIAAYEKALKLPYEDGEWTLEVQTQVLPGDDLWWICDEPPFVRCAKRGVKAVCMCEDGDVCIINSENGIEQLHERWTCVTKEEAVEMFKKMVKSKEIDLELYFEGIRSLLGSKSDTGRICDANSSREATCYTDEELDEMIAKLEEIDALVESESEVNEK